MIVSVVMPAYNAGKTVGAAVESVLAQTFKDFELIIIDDCSTDNTLSMCEGFAACDPRVRVVRHSVNRGVSEARNTGVSEAMGEWIAFLDSDDLWRRDKLEKQMAFINETGANISYTASAFIDYDGKALNYIMRAEYKLSYNMLLKKNIMSCSSIIVKRDIMHRVGFQYGTMHEDYVAWLAIVKEVGQAYGLDEPLLTYRVSKSSRSGPRVKSAMMTFRAYRAAKYGMVWAWFLTIRYAMHSFKKRMKMKRGSGGL